MPGVREDGTDGVDAGGVEEVLGDGVTAFGLY